MNGLRTTSVQRFSSRARRSADREQISPPRGVRKQRPQPACGEGREREISRAALSEVDLVLRESLCAAGSRPRRSQSTGACPEAVVVNAARCLYHELTARDVPWINCCYRYTVFTHIV